MLCAQRLTGHYRIDTVRTYVITTVQLEAFRHPSGSSLFVTIAALLKDIGVAQVKRRPHLPAPVARVSKTDGLQAE